MADNNMERRFRITWGWVGLGILVLGLLAWIVYSFFGIASEPYPPAAVDADQPAVEQVQ